MRIVLATLLLLASVTSARAETIVATVKGMVCAFCATGIEKTFKKQSAVKDVKVDLDTKLITLRTKGDKTLDDETIKKLVADAGYDITEIKRQ